ncbi:MAG TPA: HEAT repeat domain-containing protein [Tahibacter sp.]|nr:HEAT repeat domain-containing protein [Tahibacter sp.]
MIGLIFVLAATAAGSGEPPDPAALDRLIADCPVVDPDVETDRVAPGLCQRDIALYGHAAEHAGPTIVKHLKSRDLDDRAYAAVALGMIGYRPAIPDLIDTLDGKDWLLARASVRSLGWLRAVEARPYVERLARTHPLAIVRREAATALAAIDANAAPAADEQALMTSNEAFYLVFAYDFDDSNNPCERGPWHWNGRTVPMPPDVANDTETAPAANDASLPELQAVSAVLEVESGRLIGTNRGEWGGELYFQHKGSTPKKLLDENIVAIEKFGSDIVAFGGLTHMGSSKGVAIAVERKGPGYAARTMLPLPGAPRDVIRVDASTLLIVTRNANVVLRSDWHLDDAECVATNAAVPRDAAGANADDTQ